ncbi:uncharacterized protein LOC119112551 [Pollicipes pollicipes]|uniref:uncharacterized protein LOC119112551 n=1 Tax=Pollicipes pollicipes TaxID=41117 RepID=UPI0018853BFE|nr:uncharacterized protein LOC119112551 [Pollicipes pollicipes]
MLTDADVFQSRTSMIGKIARDTIYNMMDLLLLCFDARNLGEEKDVITICAELLCVPDLAEDLWAGDSALRSLLDEAADRFPADGVPLLELAAALAQAGRDSLAQMVSYLDRLPSYAVPEALVPAGTAVAALDDWTLQHDWYPERRLPKLVLPAGATGRLLPGASRLVCWRVSHSGWQQGLLFLDDLQREGQMGEQHVQPETSERAGAMARLLRAVMEHGTPEQARHLRPHIELVFPILERHYRWGCAPQPFVHHAAEVLALHARVEPDYVWEHMDRNSRWSPGRLGELIEAHECVQRRYPLTQAFLQLLLNTVPGGRRPRGSCTLARTERGPIALLGMGATFF